MDLGSLPLETKAGGWPWTPPGGALKQSPGLFRVLWERRRECVGKVCVLLGRQRLLFLGAAAGLEDTWVNHHLTKPPFVDNPTAHLLPTGKRGKRTDWYQTIDNTLINIVPFFKIQGQCHTVSSKSGQGRRRQTESNVSAWTLCLRHHLTGCCSWGTEMETCWRWCCGHLSLNGKTGQFYWQA